MKLYACIISPDAKRDRNALLSVAGQFSYTIELLDDGILFDVSGLQNLVGDADKIAQNILAELEKNSVYGNVAVAETTDTAMLLARNTGASFNPKSKITNPKSADFSQIPLQNLFIDDDTLNVFNDLGLRTIRDLQQVPKDELIDRYGQPFKKIIDVIEQKGGHLLTANIKENEVSWNHDLDFPVDDFEQLVFILNHGLDRLLSETSRYGHSTEQLDILFKLQDKTERMYEIKTSFPTLDKTFWLKLINLRISLDAPEAEIVGIHVTSHFTPPRPAQRGLYAVTRPDPERLLLTVNKLKKLVGEENVGVPVLLDERVNRPFAIDAEIVPLGKEVVESERSLAASHCGEACDAHSRSRGFAASHYGEACLAADGSKTSSEAMPRTSGVAAENKKDLATARQASPQCGAASREEGFPAVSRDRDIQHPKSKIQNPVIAFSYFNPPVPAQVLVRENKLVFVRTQFFSGHVTECSGVWKANSKWWDNAWKAQEWDVEIEDHGVYRLCKVNKDWFLAGEYD